MIWPLLHSPALSVTILTLSVTTWPFLLQPDLSFRAQSFLLQYWSFLLQPDPSFTAQPFLLQPDLLHPSPSYCNIDPSFTPQSFLLHYWPSVVILTLPLTALFHRRRYLGSCAGRWLRSLWSPPTDAGSPCSSWRGLSTSLRQWSTTHRALPGPFYDTNKDEFYIMVLLLHVSF